MVREELNDFIGTEKANIVVANALRLNGGMIAAAHRAEDGSYSEHGRLTLRVGELFVQHIYDYDDGYTLGAAISDAFAPTIGGYSGSGTTFATIGKGDISCTGETCQLGDANRDVTKPQTFEQDYDVQPITAYFPFGLPELPKTPDGKIDSDKAEANVKEQFVSVLKPFTHLFTSVLPPDEQPTEQSPLPDEEYKQEQKEALNAMEEIDDEIADYQETKDWLGPEAGIRKVAVELVIHVLKTHDPSLSTEDAFKIALPSALAAEQTVEPRLFKASAGEAVGTLGAMALGDNDPIWLGVATLAGTALALYAAYKHKIGQDDSDTLEKTKDGSTLTIKKPKTDLGAETGTPMPDPDGDLQDDDFDYDIQKNINNLNKADRSTIKSLRKEISNHRLKLSEYKQDPDKFDNKEWLKGAPNKEVRSKIIEGRIRHLEAEIKGFEEQIRDILTKSRG